MDVQLVLLPYVEASLEQQRVLLLAAATDDQYLVEKMLQLPLDPSYSCGVSAYTSQEKSPLEMAVDRGRLEVVRLLLEAGAEVPRFDYASLVEASGLSSSQIWPEARMEMVRLMWQHSPEFISIHGALQEATRKDWKGVPASMGMVNFLTHLCS